MLIIAIPVLIYIPVVQDFAKKIALEQVRKSTGMDIAVDRLRIKFPLTVELAGVSVVEASGDTMIRATTVRVDVKPLPLLKGVVDVSGAELDNGYYRLGTPDSIMYLTADISHFVADGTSLGFKSGEINVDNATLDGGRVSLIMRGDTVAPPKPESAEASTLWKIKAANISLRNLTYNMSMLPVIDTLGVNIKEATLHNGSVDMSTHTIHGDMIDMKVGNATYLTPDEAYLRNHPYTASADTSVTPYDQRWVVTAHKTRFTADTATYAVRGARPQPGLDMNYLQASGITIAVDSFYNRATDIRVTLKQLAARERCGVNLNANGVFAMDSAVMRAENFNIATSFSQISLNAIMGVGDIAANPALPLSALLQGAISLEDVDLAMPTMKPMLRDIPHGAPLRLYANIDGTSGSLNVKKISASIARFLSFEASGRVRNPFNFEKMDGKVDFNADAIALNVIKPTLLEAKLAKELNIPHTTLKGSVDYSPNIIAGKINAFVQNGRIALDGSWNQRAEGYDASLDIDRFPVDAFMPSLGVGTVTASLSANGHGLDFTKPSTLADIKLDVDHVEYLKENYRNIAIDATLKNGNAAGRLVSNNPEADIDLDFTATLADTGYTWVVDGDMRNINLEAMKLSTTPMGGSMTLGSKGSYNTKENKIDANLIIGQLKWNMDSHLFSTDSIVANIATTDSTIWFNLVNGDLRADAMSACGLDSLMRSVSGLSSVIDSIMATKRLDAIKLQAALPPLTMSLNAGANNVAQSYLNSNDIAFRSATLNFMNDSLVNLDAKVVGFTTGDTRLDTLSLGIVQHGKFLIYKAEMNNRPGTFDAFSQVAINGFVAEDKLAALVRQENVKGEKGFQLGLSAAMTDSTIHLRFVPYNPTIGYKQWTLNTDNFVDYNFVDQHLDANLIMSNNESSLKLFTVHTDSTAHSAAGVEDVVLQLHDIHIDEWLAVSPFAPPIKGDVDADLRFNWANNILAGRGNVNVRDLYYGRERVGTFTLGLKVVNQAGGIMHADASLMVDSVEVVTASGALNDSTAREPFMIDFSMIHFPLHIVNPFLPKEYARLSGMLNGRMDITGNLKQPILNGYLDFDSTKIAIPMAGTTLTFSEEKIPVDSSVVHFNDFQIKACNDNPLRINGDVDLRQLNDIKLDLTALARNMQVVNTTRARHNAQLYGKGFLNVDANVKGDMRFLSVGATVNVLAGTNITYITESTDAALTSQGTSDMVRFVQFNDTTSMLKADTIAAPTMAMDLEANIIVSQGSTINVDLSGDAQNRVSVNGEGNLTYGMSPISDGRLTGRFTINSGYVRYSPPVVRQIDFNFIEGSYVAFNGDMLNPSLNVKATEKIKANVTQSGQNSRLVDFIVTLSVTNTLENMNVEFDLSTDNDLTVQNELSAMSQQQRANQAMNLMLYNTYTGPDTKASSNLSGNPLYSFLTSQLNNWMANNVKGVDISFGMDQYDTTTNGATSTTTSYSYKVSKTLFNDRFKIIVGGNYSTDADADENFSQNLINDISFEYMLNRSGSMYVRIFRHTGYESILEGEVTQTGAGFVYKRKVSSLRDVFKFLRPRKRKPQTASPQ